jgi:hypothetical protein
MIKRIRIDAAFAGWLFIVGNAGCGSSGHGGGVSTGLPPDQKLSTLDDHGAQAACMSLTDGLVASISESQLLRAQCASLAIAASASESNGTLQIDQQKCSASTDACVKNPDQNGVEPSDTDPASVLNDSNDCSSAMAGDNLKDCVATVREYEACANALVGELQRRLAAISCANAKNLSSDDDGNDDSILETLPACQSFKAKCPTFSLDD